MQNKSKKVLGYVFIWLCLFAFIFLFRTYQQNLLLKISAPLRSFFAKTLHSLAICEQTETNILVEKLILKERQIAILEQVIQTEAINKQIANAGLFNNLVKTDTALKNIDNDLLVIAGGKKQGFEKGMVVLANNFALLGVISEALNDFSKVSLITAKESAFDIMVNQDSLAIAKGQGAGVLGADLLKKDPSIISGSVVKTTASGGKFPADIIIGEIKAVRENDAVTFSQGVISPWFLNADLGFVFVIIDFIPYIEQ